MANGIVKRYHKIHSTTGPTVPAAPPPGRIRLNAPLAAPQLAALSARQGPWTVEAVQALLDLPLPDLLYRAQTLHREHHDPTRVQLSALLSIKTGGCPEDCAYCPQSVRFDTGVEDQQLMPLDAVIEAATAARAAGASRFCMGAAWRGPKQKDLEPVIEMVKAVKALGLETCATLGMLEEGQADRLKSAGLDYYNHNLDTAPEFYNNVISTREYRTAWTRWAACAMPA